jgi:hypothetical protein
MPLNILTGIKPEPFRLTIHGTEGIGKSTFAACAPEPVFVQTEDGLGQIDVSKFPLAEDFDTVIKNLNDLLNEKHEFQTVVIDSVDWLEKLVIAKILTENKKQTLGEVGGYGGGYGLLSFYFAKVINICNELRKKKGMNIVMIAHTKIDKVIDPTGASFDQFAPRLDKRINGLVKEWSDIIAFATHHLIKKEVDEGFQKKRTVAKEIEENGNTRIIYLESSPDKVAKSRYNSLPKEMPLDGNKFFETLWEAIYNKNETKKNLTKKGSK